MHIQYILYCLFVYHIFFNVAYICQSLLLRILYYENLFEMKKI